MQNRSIHLLFAASTLMVALLLCGGVVSAERRSAHDLRAQGKAAQMRLQEAVRIAGEARAAVTLTPPAASLDTVLSYLQKSADRTGVQVKLISIERGLASERKWGESRLRLSVGARYSELKSLLADLTDRYASLAFTNLSLRPSATPGGMLDIEIVLVLYHR